MQIKPFTRFALFWVLGVILTAKVCAGEAPLDEQERGILREFMPSHCVFTGEFNQIKTTQHFNLESSGILFYNCEYGLIWLANNPFQEALIYKKNGLHFRIDEDGNKDTLTSQAHKGLAKFLIRLLNADVDYFFDSFNISKIDDGLLLVPKSNFMRKAIDKIELTSMPNLKASNGLAINTKIFGADGQNTSVNIHNLNAIATQEDGDYDAQCLAAIADSPLACKLLKRKKSNGIKH